MTIPLFAAAFARVPARIAGRVDRAPANLNFDDKCDRGFPCPIYTGGDPFHTCARDCTGTALARIAAERRRNRRVSLTATALPSRAVFWKVEKWPRRIRDWLGSALAACALIALLVAVDGRAREGFGRVASDMSHARWSAPLEPIASVVAGVSADPRFENMFLISLVGAAVVLTLLMLRT